MNVTSMVDLEKIFKNALRLALQMSQDEIYDVIQKHINIYYSDYRPDFYSRTDSFKDSLFASGIKIIVSGMECSIEIDRDYLLYRYPGGASGCDVANWANQSLHGGLDIGASHNFWDAAIEELGGESGIKSIVHKNIKYALKNSR